MASCSFRFSEGKIIHSFRFKDFRAVADAFLTQVKDHPKGIFYAADFKLYVSEEELKAHGLEECLETPTGNHSDFAQTFGISINPSEDLESYKLNLITFNQYTDKDKLVKLNEKVVAKFKETMPGLPEPEIEIRE